MIEKLLFLEPGDAAARYNLARCLIKTGDLARGERELKNVLEATKNAVLDTPVPGADGLSYRALRQMCEQGCGRGRRGG
ncbi:MAG: tetratricopeptide repeat protein [Candidatus Riflebacteria bacterium]|nr:tetratricopeptide repeat protein [Candidatus Riflebacteria bacterium]